MSRRGVWGVARACFQWLLVSAVVVWLPSAMIFSTAALGAGGLARWSSRSLAGLTG
jgi:hypothetical protein